ncbi:TAP-like protein-domain-containing protein [Chaetomium tenue]|uniref:TAP-like protein-domain-containing protein n=1 Tax=Chaetomium tenue TaxID=1854479 RepID=A0ACB7PJP2_9PEZI|nr:TAP-like protein-domain-containing protein [Chaetomium globosum]
MTFRLLSFYLASLASAGLAASAATPKVNWAPCPAGEFNTTLDLQCGNLTVPLDYTGTAESAEGKTVKLQLVKVLAPTQPSRGGIQMNFGGPGSPARGGTVLYGELLQALSGGEYDLIGLDPRGTGTTIPFVCTNNTFTMGQILNEIGSTIESDNSERRSWARGAIDANTCKEEGNADDIGEFIGTAFAARDILSVAKAISEDGLIRYWGISYGTTLGATIAAMFPDNIDKMIIDGVSNTREYYHAHADYEQWSDADLVFRYFFESCMTAQPGECALAAFNKTASELHDDAWAFIEGLRISPVATGTTFVDMGTFKSIILGELKSVGGWPAMSAALFTILYGNETESKTALQSFVQPATATPLAIASFPIVFSQYAIHCSDRTIRLDSFEAQEQAGAFKKLYEVSRFAGDTVSPITAHCAQWPWKAREVYQGEFQVKTKNPILLASNTRDAHTALRSAFNVSSGFEGSAVLEVNGTGHATFGAPSLCGFLATRAYWQNGTLPKPGSVCDAPHPFSSYTWDDVLEEVGDQRKNSTPVEKRMASPRWWM